MSATDRAAHAIVIDAAASQPVQRSDSGRLMIEAPPSSANSTAGDPTPAITSDARVTLGIMPMMPPALWDRSRLMALARSTPAEETRASLDTTRPIRPRRPQAHVRAY